LRDLSFLSDRAKRAWSAWSLVRRQITILNPNATRADERCVKLDTEAILAGLRMAGVPEPEHVWAWQHVLMLHDVAYHERRGVDVCFDHGVSCEVEVDPECDDCRERFGLDELEGLT
jgi:hypothetical protein